jgi:flagellar motility protein MotE (MotC chaperone)
MRRIGALVMAGMVLKGVVLGAWWWESVARAAREEKPAAAATGRAGVPSELFARTRGFRDALEAVRQRGVDLDQREQAVAEREAAVKALARTLEGQLAALEGTVPAAPGAGAEAASPAAGACGVAVTKIYQSMKPEEAAPILDQLDDATVKAIFGCMKEKQIGALLGVMNRDRAAALTRVLAGTPQAPKP